MVYNPLIPKRPSGGARSSGGRKEKFILSWLASLAVVMVYKLLIPKRY
jgi:hypothetical protein